MAAAEVETRNTNTITSADVEIMVFQELKPRRGWIVGVAAGAIAIGLIGLGVAQFRQKQTQSTQKQSQTAAPLPQKVTVVALGRLEPQGEAIRWQKSKNARF